MLKDSICKDSNDIALSKYQLIILEKKLSLSYIIKDLLINIYKHNVITTIDNKDNNADNIINILRITLKIYFLIT